MNKFLEMDNDEKWILKHILRQVKYGMEKGGKAGKVNVSSEVYIGLYDEDMEKFENLIQKLGGV